MIGMLEQMLMEMARRQDEQRIHGGMGEGESVFSPRKGIAPRPFRDHEQAGPAPPANEGQLSMMLRRGG